MIYCHYNSDKPFYFEQKHACWRFDLTLSVQMTKLRSFVVVYCKDNIACFQPSAISFTTRSNLQTNWHKQKLNKRRGGGGGTSRSASKIFVRWGINRNHYDLFCENIVRCNQKASSFLRQRKVVKEGFIRWIQGRCGWCILLISFSKP